MDAGRPTLLLIGAPALLGDLARRAAADGGFASIHAREVRHLAAARPARANSKRAARLDLLAPRAPQRVADLLAETGACRVVYLALRGAPRPDPRGESVDAEAARAFAEGLRRAHRLGHSPGRVIVLSWTAVYGVARGSPLLFAESFDDEPDEPEPGSPAARWAAGLREAETALGCGARAIDADFCLLRAAPVVGGPTESILSDFLAARFPLRVLGYDPPFQVLHYEDLLDGLESALAEPVSETLNLIGRGSVRLSRAAALAGRFAAPLPAALARALGPPAPGIARLRWRCLADGRRAVQLLGFAPRFAAEEALRG